MRTLGPMLFAALLSLPARTTAAEKLPQLQSADWAERCGDCHVLYHPGLLPERSWKKLTDSPENHFGRNIGTRAVDSVILDFLAANAADRSKHPISKAITESLSRWEKPVSISTTDWFEQVHKKLPKVEHFHQCPVCQQFADAGDFRVIHED